MRNRRTNYRTPRQREEVKTVIPKAIGFPDRIQTTLRYSDIWALAPGAQAGQYTYRGNSLFDPDYTSTGHQPRYFDQYAAVYSKYVVTSSSIKASVMNNVGTSPLFVVVFPSTDIPTLLTGAPASEYPRAKQSKLLGVAGYQTVAVAHKAATTTILGLKPHQINDLDFAALTGANPTQIWYWNLFFQNVNPTNLSISVSIEMEYNCEFFDRIEAPVS